MKTSYGPWAIITGASSGIGAEFARQVASAGINVVLAARRLQATEDLASELVGRHGIESRCVAVDLGAVDGPAVLIDAVGDLEVGLLVSNAGHVVPGSFLGRQPIDHESVIRLNVITPTILAHHFGRQMALRGRGGGIIFTSSIAGFGSVPWMANYGGTKAFLLSLGPALRDELAPHGIDVTVLAPGPTDTPMATETSAIQSTSLPMMHVGPVVAETLRRLPKSAIVVPGLLNKLIMFFMGRILSRRAFTHLWGRTLRTTMDPRALETNLAPAEGDEVPEDSPPSR